MTWKQDPPRLLSQDLSGSQGATGSAEASLDPLLREALQNASTHLPSAAQLEALALKVSAAAGAQAATGAATSPWSSWFAQAKLAKLAKLSLFFSGAAVWMAIALRAEPEVPVTRAPRNEPLPASRDGSEDVNETGAARETAPHVAADTQLDEERADDTREAPSPEVLAAPNTDGEPTLARPREDLSRDASRDTRPAPTHRVARTASSVDGARSGVPGAEEPDAEHPASAPRPEERRAAADPARPTELSLLSQAQGLLAKNPSAALEVIEEHARYYPHGSFSEEREALAIDALRRLGRRTHLRARARAFLQDYPASPHRERVTSWLE